MPIQLNNKCLRNNNKFTKFSTVVISRFLQTVMSNLHKVIVRSKT